MGKLDGKEEGAYVFITGRRDAAVRELGSNVTAVLARKMRGYGDAQARVIFRDLIDMPATVDITESEARYTCASIVARTRRSC